MNVVKLCDSINCKHKCFRYRTWLKEKNLRIHNIPYEIYSTLQNDDCCGDKDGSFWHNRYFAGVNFTGDPFEYFNYIELAEEE